MLFSAVSGSESRLLDVAIIIFSKLYSPEHKHQVLVICLQPRLIKYRYCKEIIKHILFEICQVFVVTFLITFFGAGAALKFRLRLH